MHLGDGEEKLIVNAKTGQGDTGDAGETHSLLQLPQRSRHKALHDEIEGNRELMNRCSKGNPDKCRVDAIEFESLNTVEPKKSEASVEPREQPESEPLSGKAEETGLSGIVLHGFTSREDIAEKCSGKWPEMSARSVSRHLKALTDKGLLQRMGNGYALTEWARKKLRQDTL
jgi:hypothetical protein